MRKLICIVLILAVICPIWAGADEEGYFILCRPGSVVNVRSNPRKTASVIAWVEFGRFVHTDGKTRNGFVHVVDLAAEETEGWISAGYLVYDRPRDETYTAQIVSNGNVIVRSCVDGKRVRVMRNGQTVTVYARSNEWAVTNRGYIRCDWLEGVEE